MSIILFDVSFIFFFKQKTAYEMRIRDWSSDVCSSDLGRDQVEAAVTGHGVQIAVQDKQLGTGHAVQQAEAGFNGFAGDVLILYGDVPLVRAATMEAMLERLYADDAPLAVVLGFRPVVPGAYGRIIAGRGGMIEKMVEYKDASEIGRAHV